jgi:hypothetical protein
LPPHVCRHCAFSLTNHTTWIISAERLYWHLSDSTEADRFRATCHHPDTRLGRNIVGCAAMQTVLTPLFPTLAAPDAPPPPGEIPPALRASLALFHDLGDDHGLTQVQRAAGIDPPEVAPGRHRFIGTDIPPEDRLDALIAAIASLPPNTLPADRVWVWAANAAPSDALSEVKIRSLAQQLRRHGPALLYCLTGRGSQHPVEVEYRGDGLMLAAVDPFVANETNTATWHAACLAGATAAAFLRRCGEWPDTSNNLDPSNPGPSNPAAINPAAINPAGPPPRPETPLAAVATALHVEESRSSDIAAAAITVSDTGGMPEHRQAFAANPGSEDVRTADLQDVVFDPAWCILLHDGSKIAESRYLVDEPSYQTVSVIPERLRFIATDKVAIIGFNRPWRDYTHWVLQILPAMVTAVQRVGRENALLVLPPMTPTLEEMLELAGLAPLPRLVVDLDRQYHFPRVCFSEFLRGHTAFSLSPRMLGVLHEIARTIEPIPGTPDRLYIAPPDSQERRLRNEDAVRALLLSRGFRTVVPASWSTAHRIRLFKGATMIVGPHSAGLVNIAFCRPATKVLELVQATYPNACMTRLAQVNQLAYHAEFFDSASEDNDASSPAASHASSPAASRASSPAASHASSWTIDLDQLARILDQLGI